jgi:2OG-Fe(II) oxygenase superfamily
MPETFRDLAVRAAAEAGFVDYDPDACLINRYLAGTKLGLHQDRDEKDAWALIVSVSLAWPPYSCGAAGAAPIQCVACIPKTVTLQCGVVPHASSITASLRSRTGSNPPTGAAHQSYVPKGALISLPSRTVNRSAGLGDGEVWSDSS